MTDEVSAPGQASLLKFYSPNDHALSNLRNRVIYCQHYVRFNAALGSKRTKSPVAATAGSEP